LAAKHSGGNAGICQAAVPIVESHRESQIHAPA
jgi:hypothetical protein